MYVETQVYPKLNCDTHGTRLRVAGAKSHGKLFSSSNTYTSLSRIYLGGRNEYRSLYVHTVDTDKGHRRFSSVGAP